MGYVVQKVVQQKQITAGLGLIDVTHVDFMTDNGMLYYVEVPLAESTPEGIDAAIQQKIDRMNAILQLGHP